MQLAKEEPQPFDKAAFLVAFVEAMQANVAHSPKSSQADMDEAIRKQKELEEMCAHQRHMLLLYQQWRKMESVHSPTTIQEMLKLAPEVKRVVLDMYEPGMLDTLAEKQSNNAQRKAEQEKKEDKKAATPGILGAAGGFGDPEKIVATGAVKITQKAVGGKPPVVASAAVLTYDAKTGEIILNGGFPWVQQGATFMRAKEANLYLRIKKDGSFVTEGLWDMGGQLNANPAPPKPAPKPANP